MPFAAVSVCLYSLQLLLRRLPPPDGFAKMALHFWIAPALAYAFCSLGAALPLFSSCLNAAAFYLCQVYVCQRAASSSLAADLPLHVQMYRCACLSYLLPVVGLPFLCWKPSLHRIIRGLIGRDYTRAGGVGSVPPVVPRAPEGFRRWWPSAGAEGSLPLSRTRHVAVTRRHRRRVVHLCALASVLQGKLSALVAALPLEQNVGAIARLLASA
jgi:hypothetical protein